MPISRGDTPLTSTALGGEKIIKVVEENYKDTVFELVQFEYIYYVYHVYNILKEFPTNNF